jgi:hypothetical protein
MQSTLYEPTADSAWQQLSPLLDEAMAGLRAKERDAILLRYFENKTLREVGLALGVEESAAQKRVARGLEKLRSWFARHGFMITTTTIAGAVSAHALPAAPAEASAATIHAVAASSTATKTIGLVKATTDAMVYSTLQTVGIVGAILLAVTGAILFLARNSPEHSTREAAVLLPVPRAPEFVEIVAEIEMMGWSGDPRDAPAKTNMITFSLACITGQRAWSIQNNLQGNAEEKWLFDGTNVYNSVRILKPMSDESRENFEARTRIAVVPFDRAQSNLTIRVWPSQDGHPLGDYGENLPWLAFCSGSYMKREGRLIPLPCSILRHTRDRFAYTDKTITFKDELGLPQSVSLFTSKSLLKASEDDFDRDYSFGDRYANFKSKIVSELQEGVLTFQYTVLETTNFLGRTFPTKFEFLQNGRTYEQNGNWFCRGTGRVKSIRPSAPPKSLFNPSLQQTMADWRFRDPAAKLNGITYTTTNSFLLPTNDPALQEKVQAQIERVARQRR